MFYRVTRYQYPEARYDEIVAWADSKVAELRSIRGLQFVDEFTSGPGEAVIVAAYESEADFQAAAEMAQALFAEMAQFLTAPPVTSSGTVTWTTRT